MASRGVSEGRCSVTYNPCEPLRKPGLEEGDCLPISPGPCVSQIEEATVGVRVIPHRE